MSTKPASFRPALQMADERPARGRWFAAFLLALVLHAVGGALISWVGLPTARPLAATVSPPISFVFAQPAVVPDAGTNGPQSGAQSAPKEQPQPTRFTELPPDRADVPPERADFLSNVDSRARDRREGGDANSLPYMEGRSDEPAVAMRPESPTPPGGAVAPDASPEVGAEGPADAPEQAQEALGQGAGPTPANPSVRPKEGTRGRRGGRVGDPRHDLIQPGGGMATPSLLQQLGGGDIYQEEMNNLLGNAMQFGAVSLSTTAWNFAPWVQRFLRDVSRNWRAPYAYYLGVINGYTEVQMEIAPDGRMLRADIVGESGHESLHQSSLAAVHAAAPYQPLPKDFPDPTLVLRLKMTYLPPPPR